MDFTMGLPIILNLSPKTPKNIFSKSSFQKNIANFDVWFFPNEKYGSRGPAKIGQTGFIPG